MARHYITLDPTAGTSRESSPFYGSGHREQKEYGMKEGHARSNFTIIGNDTTHTDYSLRVTKGGDIAITQTLSSKNAKQIHAQGYASGNHGDQAFATIDMYSSGYKANLDGYCNEAQVTEWLAMVGHKANYASADESQGIITTHMWTATSRHSGIIISAISAST